MKQQPIIGGIQQIGIGNPNTYELWAWYRKAFFVDIPIFDEAATAELMLPYTGGEPRKRHAVLAMSMQGGGGLEIWQYTERTPEPISFEGAIGDLGIYVLKIKSKDVRRTYKHLQTIKVNTVSEPGLDPNSEKANVISICNTVLTVIFVIELITKVVALTAKV